MKEDQEYTVMEPGALLLPRSSTGPLSLLLQGKAPALEERGRPLKLEGNRIEPDRIPGIESLRISWVEVSLLFYCLGWQWFLWAVRFSAVKTRGSDKHKSEPPALL